MRILFLILLITLIAGCDDTEHKQVNDRDIDDKAERITLTLAEANRLSTLPIHCIQQPLPYKSGVVIGKEEDLAMPQVHHPAFYGCFDWHSAVHGHWSLVYLLKEFPQLQDRDRALRMLQENLTADNIEQEVTYFSLNKESKSFERTYGWAWVLKLAEELYTWDDPVAQELYANLTPLCQYISNGYIEYLPKLSLIHI